MKFSAARTVRFSDCDPAGIVFFPQYFVMLNGFVEQWFDEGLKISYAQFIGARRTGLPTVKLEAEFTRISRHGDALVFSAQVERLGHSSLTLQTEVHGTDELRMRARQVLVCTSLIDHKPQALPGDVRTALAPYCGEAEPMAADILLPPGWAAPRGYANGVSVTPTAGGRHVFVAGQIGWNAQCAFDSDDLVAQTRQALANVRAVLAEAGATPQHIVRMTWYLTDKREYLARGREIGAAYRELIGSYAVAMSAVQVLALMEDRAQVEIEVTAIVP